MVRIALINMPFASAALPSIALTQLRAAVQQRLGGRVESEIFYLSHDFASYLGPGLYTAIADSVEAVTSGLGDWFFRSAAFPGLPDDPDRYLNRHFSDRRQELAAVRPLLLARRQTAGAFLSELVRRYRLDTFPLVGFTSNFSQNVACFALARQLKARDPGIVTVMGGANCETSMGRVLAADAEPIDYVFSGPALRSFPEFLERWLAGDVTRCREIRGVYSRAKLAAWADGQPDEAGEELDIDVELALDYDDFLASFDAKLPRGAVEPMLLFETSRGCWWGERAHCTFCGLNGMGMGYRAMRPELALGLMRDLFARYEGRVARFQCVDNIMPRPYLTEVFPHLAPPAGGSIFYEVKADLKPAELAVLARAGVTEIQPGIEALATSTLKLMRKGTTSFQNLRFLKECLRHGIRPHWNLLVGFPGEPEEVYEKYCRDLPLLVHLPPPSGAFPVRFDRFSPYHTRPGDYGLALRPCDFYPMIYPFPAGDLAAMAYYFVDTNYQAPYVQSTARWLARLREHVQHWQDRWQRRDGLPAPGLGFVERAGVRVVADSRSGRAVEHDVGPTALRILDLLAVQAKLTRLVEQLPDRAAAEVERELAALERLGLLFREGDLYLSLILEPPPADADARHPAAAGRWAAPAPPSSPRPAAGA